MRGAGEGDPEQQGLKESMKRGSIHISWEEEDTCPPHEPIRFVPNFALPVPKPKEGNMPPPKVHQAPATKSAKHLLATIVLPDNMELPMTVTALDAAGNPVSLPPGSLSWLVDNAAGMTLTPSSDTLSCVCTPVGPLGVYNVTVSSTGALVATGQLQITVAASAPVAITVVPGAPTPITPPSPPTP
jgi:hypothetical protein